MKRALIIGISGQDGSYLADFLLKKGYEVHGTSRDHEMCLFHNAAFLGVREKITFHSISLADFRSVISTIQKVMPDEIYNLAGQTSVGLSFSYPVETFESISLGTLHLLECLRLLKADIRLYNAGSCEVFGNTPKIANEKTALHPRSPYAAAKAAAQYTTTNYREAYHLFCCNGIMFNHESPLRPMRFVTQKIVSGACAIHAGSSTRLKLGRLDIERDWGWAPEYVQAMWLMLQQAEPRDYVIATGIHHSLRYFVEQVFARLRLDWKEFVDTDDCLMRPSDIDISFGDASCALQDLGWKPTVFLDEIITRLVQEKQKLLSGASLPLSP
jgi:GDPmannose 4,6-dehydratase